MFFLPETPRYLAKVENELKCEVVLTEVYKPPYVPKELNNLTNEVREQKKKTGSMTLPEQVKELFTTYKRCIFAGCMC